jgi:hypothetical protein
MHRRFDSVGEANHETFEWILDEEYKNEEEEEEEEEDEEEEEEEENEEVEDFFPEEKEGAEKSGTNRSTSDEEPESEESNHEDQSNASMSAKDEWPEELQPWLSREDTKASEKRALFRHWLQFGSEIFHIAGKLGSGKSTLMKFLCNDSRSTNMLETWAAGRQLVIGKFFFWKPGSEIENSINGMVRTLLYDVLRQCPDLISLVLPGQWQEVQELSWQATGTLRLNSDETNKAFRRLFNFRNSGRPRCFCFFIDGLDEFDGVGKQDYGDLVHILCSWT